MNTPIRFGGDYETYPLGRGLLIPHPVCLTLAWKADDPQPFVDMLGLGGFKQGHAFEFAKVGTRFEAICTEQAMEKASRRMLEACAEGDAFGIFHNLPYDLAVAAEVAKSPTLAYDALVAPRGGLACTKVREQLLAIAHDRVKHDPLMFNAPTKYDLATLVRRYMALDISDGKKWKPNIPQKPKGLSKGAYDAYKEAVALIAPFLDDAPWRVKYHVLEGHPLRDWPEDAKDYAMSDATYADEVYAYQALERFGKDGTPLVVDVKDGDLPWRHGRPVPRNGMIVDEDYQTQAAFAFHVMAAYGLRTDPESVAEFEHRVLEENAKCIAIGTELGFVRPNGSKDTKILHGLIQAAYERAGMDVPRTPTGAVSATTDVLEKSGDERLIAYAEFLGAGKMISTYLESAKTATTQPLTSSPNVLVATGRVSWRAPNLTNPPRLGGYRECHAPRKGYVYSIVDYDAAEMVALAQVLLLLGFSPAMADAINAGKDLHVAFAADQAGLSYEEAYALHKAKDPDFAVLRQDAKAANFGFPGGMGIDTFCEAQSKAGRPITPEQAKRLKDAYVGTWGMGEYFNYISKMTAGGQFVAHHYVSMRQRGGVGYCDGCNTFFQGYVADAAKRAAFALSRAAYTGVYKPPRPVTPSPYFDVPNPHAPPRAELGRILKGARPVLFIHDEIIAEVPEDRAAEMGEAHAEIMRLEFQAIVPDVRVGAGPALARRWYKGAGTVYDANGVLQIWEPKVA